MQLHGGAWSGEQELLVVLVVEGAATNGRVLGRVGGDGGGDASHELGTAVEDGRRWRRLLASSVRSGWRRVTAPVVEPPRANASPGKDHSPGSLVQAFLIEKSVGARRYKAKPQKQDCHEAKQACGRTRRAADSFPTTCKKPQ